LRPRLFPLGGAFLAALALLLVLSGADTIRAGTFSPVLKVTVADPKPEANSDFTTDFNVPKGDVNFAAVISFIPKHWGITPGKDIPIGAVVGNLASKATLGLINSACNTGLPVAFTMLNASTDPAVTVPYVDKDNNGIGDVYEDKDKNGLKDGIEKYPDFITRLLKDANGKPLQPLRRAAGTTSVAAGVNVLLQFLIFAPGTVISAALPHDVDLGYPSVTLLLDTGDPAAVPAPGHITDFCTPLTSSNTSFGISKDNPDTKSVNEGGKVLSANPKDAKYTFTTIALGQRDADNDGFENDLDTCPVTRNKGDSRIPGDGDADTDGLDAACDPNDGQTNSDEDGDGYLNRGDNCPLVANGQDQDNQKDTDNDSIGDACDPKPNEADAQGKLVSAQVTADVTIGGGTGTPDYPSGFGPGGGGGGGGGSNTLIIVIVVVAAIVVVGGGAALWMRRRRA